MPLYNLFMIDWFLFQEEKDYKKLLENALEILEKEKEKEVFSILNFWPEGPASLACFFLPIPKPSEPLGPISPRAQLLSHALRGGPAQPSAAGAAALSFFLSVSLTSGARLSASSSSSCS
jgi:hypothetical protein